PCRSLSTIGHAGRRQRRRPAASPGETASGGRTRMRAGSRWGAAARWRRTGFRRPAAGAIFAICLAAAGLALAAAGDLDAAFGTGGLFVLPFAAESRDGRAVVIQPDGKIVVAGFRIRAAGSAV